MTKKARSENFTTIQYPETRIQDQSILAPVFIASDKIDFKILCNYRVNLIPNTPAVHANVNGGASLNGIKGDIEPIDR